MMQLTASSLSYISTGFNYIRSLEAKILTHRKGEFFSPFVRIRFWESPISGFFCTYILLVSFMALLLIIVFDFVGNSYLDILHSNKRPFYNRGSEEDSSAMDAYLMHSVCAHLHSFF